MGRFLNYLSINPIIYLDDLINFTFQSLKENQPDIAIDKIGATVHLNGKLLLHFVITGQMEEATIRKEVYKFIFYALLDDTFILDENEQLALRIGKI